VEPNPVCKEESAEEFMWRKRKPAEDESEKEYPESRGWPRDDFWSTNANLHGVILQNAGLRGLLQIPLQELGLDPVFHGGSSESAALVLVLAFFMAPATVPATEDPLLPMAAVLG
jgi:hypothetical protein